MSKAKSTEPAHEEHVGALATFSNTGDTLAKPEHQPQQPAAALLSAYGGTSIIAQMPKAEIADKTEDVPISKGDYESAKEVILLTMAKHFLLTTPDAFAHSKVRAAVALIEQYDNDQTINQTTATGGGVPVQDGPTNTVDADPIPVSSTTTTDPTVQPIDPVTPAFPE